MPTKLKSGGVQLAFRYMVGDQGIVTEPWHWIGLYPKF